METCDFIDALPGEHENADRPRVGRVSRRVRTFEPAVEAQELLLIEPAGSHLFGLGGNAGCGVVDEAETSLRYAAVIVLRFHAPAIGRSDVAAHVIRH